jgi:hypothetical protein
MDLFHSERTSPMLAFHATVHRRPAEASVGDEVRLGGLSFRSLTVPHERLGTTTFDCSFEAAADALGALERLYCEPDGSFVWVSCQGDPPWQVDGNLYDKDQRLRFVDIKGRCPAPQFDRLLGALGWPSAPLMFQLVREAIFLDEDEFRRYAAQAAQMNS